MGEDRRDLLVYGAAIVAYIAIGFFTKRLLTWNIAFVYFVMVIEVLPRLARWAFRRGDRGTS